MGLLIFISGMLFLFGLAFLIFGFFEHISVKYGNYYHKDGKCLQLLPCIELYYHYERGSDTSNGLFIGWLYWSIEFVYND